MEHVLRELVDALLAEGLLGTGACCEVGTSLPSGMTAPFLPLAQGEAYLRLSRGQGSGGLLMRVRSQPFLQPYRLSRPPVLATAGEGGWEELEPVGLMRWLAEALSASEGEMPGLESFLAALADAVERGSMALMVEESLGKPFRAAHGAPSLMDWERLAALRDRPFHPIARAKAGWSPEDARRYGPEWGEHFGLDWVAVRRTRLQLGSAAREVEPAACLLAPEEAARLALAMKEAELPTGEYLALPVHPWQFAHVLPTLYAGELASRECVPVARALGRLSATASLRTLASANGTGPHLKLPLGIESLGALRTLPPRYLMNGERAAALLELLRERDPVLQRRLHLCDEQRWWAFREPSGDLFADKPAHLACQLREIPAEVSSQPGTRLVPMAALAVATSDGQAPGIDLLLRERTGSGGALALFEELCEMLVDVSLRCFRLGVMPELHGQNVLLVVHAGRVEGVLLRDHDTLRIHAPWLRAHGLQAPAYVLKPGTPNTLTLETPEELLGYFQTLAVQVNLYAITEVLSRSHGLGLEQAWRVLREVIAASLDRLDDGLVPAREVGERRLLAASEWPFKCILRPLLKRAGAAGTGMPGAMGVTRSPFVSPRPLPRWAGGAR